MKKVWMLFAMITLFCMVIMIITCYPTQAHGENLDDIIESILDTTKLKLKYFHYTGDFNIFHDIETNKNIVGLDSEQDIRRFRRDQGNLWCFVPVQLFRNYLINVGIPAYILLIRSNRLLQPYRWDYHMVVALNLADGRVAVVDPSIENSGPSEAENYIRRFNNKDIKLIPIRSNEDLERFLQPTEMMKPKKKFFGKSVKPNFGREI